MLKALNMASLPGVVVAAGTGLGGGGGGFVPPGGAPGGRPPFGDRPPRRN